MTAIRDPDLPHAGSRAPRAVSPGRRWVAPVAVGATVACGCAAIALTDPGDSGTPLCWSQAVLGIDCPFCGGLRCTNALLRGDWLAAADHNVLLAVALPVLAVLWTVWLVRSLQGRTMTLPRPPRSVWMGVALFLVAFTVARNVGGPAWVDWLNSGTYRS